jgi:hypothetical protein
MDQTEIIKNTVIRTIENNKVPHAIDIDPNVKLTPISILEYINIINSKDKMPDELSNYKIFFSTKLGTEFIFSNYGETKFINKREKEDSDKMKIDDTIDQHIPSPEEVALFNDFFKL